MLLLNFFRNFICKRITNARKFRAFDTLLKPIRKDLYREIFYLPTKSRLGYFLVHYYVHENLIILYECFILMNFKREGLLTANSKKKIKSIKIK